MNSKQTIALALSGGGMRGCAHIGVIRRLEEVGLEPACISGTSIGAIVGALKADGYNSLEIEEIFIKSKFGFDFNYFRFSEALLSSQRMEEILKKNLRSKNFEQLTTPLWVCVTNYKSGEAEYLNSGKLLNAVLASAAIPLLYKPVKINGQLYVDGGLSRNLPTEPLKNTALPIVGVHVNPMDKNIEDQSLTKKMDHIIHLLMRERIRLASKDCRVFIEPEQLSAYTLFETKMTKGLIEIGYRKAEKLLEPGLFSSLKT